MPDLRDQLAAALAPRYTVERQFAAGGMATIYLGHDPVLGREVAIKVLPPDQATAVAVERFRREARLLAQLSHPNIVPIFEAQDCDGLFWFVMPLLKGQTLAHQLAAGALAPAEVQRIGCDLLHGLANAHAHGVVHRDIKPSNIFFDGDRALLADFGVALLRGPDSATVTATAQVIGTYRYMAPEQRVGIEADVRSDIYAVGITLFEAATGTPWGTPDAMTSRSWRGLPPSLRRAIRGATCPEPSARWPNADAMRRALDLRGWSRSRVAAATALMGIGALAMFGAVRRNAVGAAPRQRDALIILPFTGTTDSSARTLSQYAGQLIGFTPVRMRLPPTSSAVTFDSARRIADRVVVGIVTLDSAGDGNIVLQVFDSGGRPLHLLHVPRDHRDIPAWGLAIADALVERLFPTELTEFRQLAGTEPNREALDAYREGQRLFEGGRWHEAEEKFAAAERADTTLLRATWQRLIAREWQGLPFIDALTTLQAHAGQMRQPFPRLLQAQFEPDLDLRMALYDSLVREYPAYSMVRLMAANELFSRGPLIGRPLREGIEAFQASARDIPDLDQPNTYTQTVWGALRLGDVRLAREQLALRRAPPGDQWAQPLWLAVNGRFRRWLAGPALHLALILADSADFVTLERAVRLGLAVDDPVDQEIIAAALEKRAGTDRQRSNALAARATALLLLGQPMLALHQLDVGAAHTPAGSGYRSQSAQWRVLLPLIAGGPIALPAATRDSGRAALAAIPAADPRWPGAAWALSLDATARGDRRAADSLRAALHARKDGAWVDDLAAFADAFAVAAAGNTDSALVLTQRIHRMPTDTAIALRGPLVRALVYFGRGAWRKANGDAAGAEREWLWHENSDVAGKVDGAPDQGELDEALSGIARLLRADNLPQLDRRADACTLVHRVDELWRHAEPLLQPLRDLAIRVSGACQTS